MQKISVLIVSMRSSTNLGIAELLKSNHDGRPISVYHAGVIDESHMPQNFFNEGYVVLPSPDKPEYLKLIKELCKEKKIDVVIPRDSRMLNREQGIELEQDGYKVIRPRNPISDMVADKLRLAKWARKIGIDAPTSIVVNNVREFKTAVLELQDEGFTVCFKPRKGLGGRGFRIIREFDELHNLLYGYQGPSINLETAIEILSSQESFDDLLVMNYLEGVEYSVDCLSWRGKPLAIIPRKKVEYAQLGSYSVQLLEKEEEIIELSKQLIKEFRLDYVNNIQFRYSKGKPYLIEINRRMSGGITLASLSGVNFPYLAVKLALGEEVIQTTPCLGQLVVRKPSEILLKC